MAVVREPTLTKVSIASLRPTQITVGKKEVDEKRQRWRRLNTKKRSEFLGRHMMPVILGPNGHHYIIDHHHLARALHDEGVRDVLVTVVKDLKDLKREEFLVFLDHHSWIYPYDARGRRCRFEDIPKSISDLQDDPFRSLAGELRRVGAFAKDTTPFSEFLWADFLRRRMKRKIVEKDFRIAVKKAFKLARGRKAEHLPGWCGPISKP